jgi:hypothetical protein
MNINHFSTQVLHSYVEFVNNSDPSWILLLKVVYNILVHHTKLVARFEFGFSLYVIYSSD